MARWCVGSGVCARVRVRAHMCFHVCRQIDTFVLFALRIRSQGHRHFGNRIVEDKHVMESTLCEGGFRRFERKREERDVF